MRYGSINKVCTARILISYCKGFPIASLYTAGFVSEEYTETDVEEWTELRVPLRSVYSGGASTHPFSSLTQGTHCTWLLYLLDFPTAPRSSGEEDIECAAIIG